MLADSNSMLVLLVTIGYAVVSGTHKQAVKHTKVVSLLHMQATKRDCGRDLGILSQQYQR